MPVSLARRAWPRNLLDLYTRLRQFFAPFCGVLAQLVERLNGIEEVRGSNPLGSTTPTAFQTETGSATRS